MGHDVYGDVVRLVRAGRLAEADAAVAAALDAGDDGVDVLRAAAHVAFGAGDDGAALDWMDRAVARSGGDVRVRMERVQLLAAAGDLAGAIAEAGELAEAASDAGTWGVLGRLLYQARREAEAAAAFARALEGDPLNDRYLRGRGESLFAAERFDEAQGAFDALAARAPHDVEVQLRSIACSARLGAVEEATDRLRTLKSRVGPRADISMAEGRLLEDVGEAGAARTAYLEAMQQAPSWPEPVGASLMLDHAAPADDVLRRAERMVADPGTSASERAFLHYALGKVDDAASRYDGAWAHWVEANRLRRGESVAEADDALDRRVESLERLYTREFVDAVSRQVEPDPRPLLIVGMPRSGTTLVDRILAAHTGARSAGESSMLAQLHRDHAAAIGSGRFDGPMARVAAERYLASLVRRAGGSATRVVDKQPYNFMFLGLAAALLPGARIVWCRRDPRDVAVSIFSENFAAPARYATDLVEIRRLGEAQVSLMRHWQEALPVQVLEVDYETLVSDFEAQARRLVEFAGLPWEPACLDFHRTDGAVQTNSRWQVRRPINARSVGRWRHYARFLGDAGFEVT